MDSAHPEISNARLLWEAILQETTHIHAIPSHVQSLVQALISDAMSATVYSKISSMERHVAAAVTATMVSAVALPLVVKLAVGSMTTKL